MKKLVSLISFVCLAMLGFSASFPTFSHVQGAHRRQQGQRLPEPPGAEAVKPIVHTYDIDGVNRTALVYPNTTATPEGGAPLVFVFHGHGGTAKNAAKKFQLHLLWPDAVVAYLQGIPGVEGVNDPAGKQTGWQKDPGEVGDRDLKFFDAVLSDIQAQARIDARRIFVLGHSNGGRFSHLLWHERGDVIAAVCSAGGHGGTLIPQCFPRSVFMIAGEADPIAPYAGQLASITAARRLLQTDPAKAVKQGYASLEPGPNNLELGTYLHPGGHEFPKPALALAVEFFKRQHLN